MVRGSPLEHPSTDAVYRTYLLVARARRTGASGYFEQFAHEDDDAAVARRSRSELRRSLRGSTERAGPCF